MYRLLCRCGQETRVRATQAGCKVACTCGAQNQVPSLRQLKDHQERGEPAPAVLASNSAIDQQVADANRSRPEEVVHHLCGAIGWEGSVSASAMNHYVELVIKKIQEATNSLGQLSHCDLFVSIALSPNGKKRIEIDYYPKLSLHAEDVRLIKRIDQIATPPIHHSPVAFAVYKRRRSGDGSTEPLVAFPRLTASIQTIGLELAIYRAFGVPLPTYAAHTPGLVDTESATWWRRLLACWKPSTAIPTQASVREHYRSQVIWLQDCEALAEQTSWIDLKRAIVDNPDDLRLRVALAAKHSQSAEWDVAISWYDNLLSQIGDFTPLLSCRAHLHQITGNLQAALNDYSLAIEQAPHELLFRLQRSAIYAELGAWDQAEQDLDAAIRLAPIDPVPLFYRAQTRIQLDRPAEALTDFREAIRLDPNFGYAYSNLGWLQFCTEHNAAESALEQLTRAIELVNDDPSIRLQRSYIYLSQNKFALALEDCDHVLAHDPEDASAHGIRGRILQCDGRFTEAIETCTRAIDLGNEQPSVYLARAISYAATDQPTLAASDCEVVLASEPDNIDAIQLQGKLKLQTGDLDAAMEAFHRASHLAPEWAEPREHLSLVHRIKENPQAAVEEQTVVIECHPRQASHYVNRAFAFTQLGDFHAASSDYDRAIELDPENEKIYFLRGIFRMNRQQHELSLADFERVLALSGDDENARANRASVLLQLRRYQGAIDDYTRLIAQHTENLYAYIGRAIAFASMGKTDRAQEDVQRFAELAPEYAGQCQLDIQIANILRLVCMEGYNAALKAANEIVVESPELSIGYRMRGYVHWEREEYVEAYDDYTMVIQMDGPAADCLSSRGQIQAELGEWEQALVDLNQSVELARQSGQTLTLAYALNGRSLAFAGLDREEDSQRDFTESVGLCPTNPWVYYHQGMRKYYLKQLTDAKTLLELALKLNSPPLSKRKKQRAKIALEKIQEAMSSGGTHGD